jgi:peptide/nickel transport system permease protein
LIDSSCAAHSWTRARFSDETLGLDGSDGGGSSVTAYVLRRLFFAVFVLWGAVTVIFIVMRLVPGDPVSVLLGPTATLEQIADAQERLGLAEPLPQQYLLFLQGVLRFDFGDSLRLGGEAMDVVLARLPATIQLGLVAMMLTLLLSFPLGIAAALKPRGLLDRFISTFSLAGQSIPNFWIGIMLILVMSRTLNLLPSGGNASWRHFIMPAVTLALPFLSVLVRLIRSGLLEVMNEGYIQTARAKGFRERVVIFRHGVRNMLIPVVTVAGLQMGSLLGGTVIVETVFAWPGVGRLLVDSISNRDYAVVQATIFLIAATFVLLNLLVDVLYGYLDPRVRVGD